MILAIITTFLFATSAVSAGRSTRLLGGSVANFARLTLATVFLALWAHGFGQGLGGGALRWFLLSGIIGFGMGDLGLYGAYPRIGPRLGVLLCLCLSVPISALIEFIWLGTALSMAQVFWITVILVGVVMAVVPERTNLGHERQWLSGILMGTVAALGQGSGAVITRKGYMTAQALGLHVDGGTAAYQRILGGLGLTLLVLALVRLVKRAHRKKQISSPVTSSLPWKQAWPWVVINALSGPAIGVACFQWALAVAPTGIVMAIIATTPLAVIPLTWIIDKERPHIYSLFGGVLAVSGAVALALI
ncbi:MAG: DMT family transporter [Phycisphaerae bacterium]|nr:DMT family transporter [Phycisphaerae bacterium]